MANSLSKVEQIAFEEMTDAFENSNLFAANSRIYKPNAGAAEMAGQTFRFPYANQIETTKGLDITGNEKDAVEITVPVSLGSGDIYNGFFKLSALERNRDGLVTRKVLAAVRKMSSDLNKDASDLIVARGALVGAETSDLTKYEHFSKAGSMLSEIEVANPADQYMYLNPRMSGKVANELGMRATDNNRDHAAYGKRQLPQIDMFDVFQVSNVKQIAGSSVTGLTVSGANQDVTPVAYNSDGGYASRESDDIRTQSITLSGSAPANESVITLAGCNRIGIDSKTDTGEKMTFRVVSGGGTTTPTISPAIVASGPYQNVSAAPGDGATVTVVNTASATPAVFTTKDAYCIFVSELDSEALEGSMDVIGAYTTSYGLGVAMFRQGKIGDLSSQYRLSMWAKPNIVDPLRCGILLPNQTTAI